MKYKVLESFAGELCGHRNEIISITDKTANDLLEARYIEPVKVSAAKGSSKGVETDEKLSCVSFALSVFLRIITIYQNNIRQ